MQVNIAQVQAVHLVSSSIPNLAPGDVTVVDNYGNLLTENNLDPSMGLTAKQMSHKNKAEETYRNMNNSITCTSCRKTKCKVSSQYRYEFYGN